MSFISVSLVFSKELTNTYESFIRHYSGGPILIWEPPDCPGVRRSNPHTPLSKVAFRQGTAERPASGDRGTGQQFSSNQLGLSTSEPSNLDDKYFALLRSTS